MKEIMPVNASAHKAQEFEEMFGPLGYTAKTLLDLKGNIEIEETGTTLEENALIKTKAVHEHLEIEVIVDNSGLVVNILGGVPGVYSARFTGRDTSYDVRNQYLIDQCRHTEDRGCQFTCVIAYVQTDGSEHIPTGVVEGTAANRMEGAKGFGYDPIFYYPPYGTTLVNVSEEQKDRVSHHGCALARLAAFMEKEK